MEDADEEPLCRVCRQGADGGELFFPCKCSGSIKYIHEDCLKAWLSHAGSDRCELCGHAFEFSPVYAAGTPKRLSLTELLSAMWDPVRGGILASARGVYVLLLWGAALPIASVGL